MDESSFLQDDFADYTVDLGGSDDIQMTDALPLDLSLGASADVSAVSSSAAPTSAVTTAATTSGSQAATTSTAATSAMGVSGTEDAAMAVDGAEKASVSFDKNEFTFLPQVHAILQDILKGGNSDDIGKAVVQLSGKIEQARLILQDLPGLHYDQQGQEAILQRELDILQTKKNQLATYTSLPAFTGNPK